MPKKTNTDCLRARGERLAQYADQAFRSMCVCVCVRVAGPSGARQRSPNDPRSADNLDRIRREGRLSRARKSKDSVPSFPAAQII